MTNLTDKFSNLGEQLRGGRAADVVTALVSELAGPIAQAIAESPLAQNIIAELVASALSQNIANDLVGSALAQNIANDLVGSALAQNIAQATAQGLDPRLAEILGQIQFHGQNIAGEFGPLIGQVYSLEEAIAPKLNTIIAAIQTLADCCAALGDAINNLRLDVQTSNQELGKIGSNLTDIGAGAPPDPGTPPPAQGGISFWECGEVYPLWLYQTTDAQTGENIYKAWTEDAYPGAQGGGALGPRASRWYGYQNGWNAGTGGYGIAFESGTYSVQAVNLSAGAMYLGVGPLANDISGGIIETVTAQVSLDVIWRGSGTPNGAGVKVCRGLTVQ